MNNEGNNEETQSIWQSAVSLGHLVVAVAGIVAAGATYLVASSTATEKRFVTLELRQQSNLDYIQRDQMDMQNLRRETLERLNQINNELTLLRIDIVRHQATTDPKPTLVK